MAVTSIALTPEYRYVLDDTGPILTAHKLRYEGHRHIMTPPPAGSVMTMLATSDDYLFVLHADGSVWRYHVNAEVWNQVPAPLGTTFIATMQEELHFLHSGGTAISATRLPADCPPFLTDTVGLTNIKSFAGDEKQRAILLDNGTVVVQHYHQGSPETIPVPPNVDQIEIGLEFIYVRTAAGEVFRMKNYRLSGFDILDGMIGATEIAIRSDHVDDLYIWTPTGLTTVPSESWQGRPPPPDGWVVADFVTADWVIVA